MEYVLLFRKMSDVARTPRIKKDAAGFDLASAVKATIPARKSIVIPTDIGLTLPRGCYGRIASRSKLAMKYGIDVGAGVVDHFYNGQNIKIVLFNHSDIDFKIEVGDYIAQIICEKIAVPRLVEEVCDV